MDGESRDFFPESGSNDVPDVIFIFFVQEKLHLACFSVLS